MDDQISQPVDPAGADDPGEAALGWDSADFDLDGALRMVGGDREILKGIGAIFQRQGPERLTKLHEALAEGDVDAFERTAHSIKGTASQLSMPHLQEVARQLEELGNQSALAEAPPLMTELDASLGRALAALGQVIGEA